MNTYSYNDQNRLTDVTKTVNGTVTETTSFTYDNNGNQLSTTVNGSVTATNGYDKLNQLTSTVTNGTTTSNVYNGEGYRVQKTVDGNVTKYMLEGDRIVLETDGSGNQTDRNVYGTNLLARTVGGQTFNYMYNGHADTTALVESVTGSVYGTYYYGAFGNISEQTGNVNNSITYAGYSYEKDSKLYYLNARMYDPVTARFMQEDTNKGEANDPLSLNLYTYCANNPITYSDPTGNTYANIQIGDKKIGNAQYIDGKTYGNLHDIVGGLGGKVEDIKNKDGNILGYNVFMKNGSSYYYDTEKFGDIGNKASVRDFTNMAGYQDTLSYWTDSSKDTMNVIVRPEMKDAPVSVIRREGKVDIDLYYQIKGDAANANYSGSIVSDKGKSYKSFVTKGFELWENNGKPYSIDGQDVTVNVNQHEKQSGDNGTQKYFDIYLTNEDSSQFNTQLPKLSSWSYSNPGTMYLNTGIKTRNERTDEDFAWTTAHEMGHLLGLSDAYNVAANRWDLSENQKPAWYQKAWDLMPSTLAGPDAAQNYHRNTSAPLQYEGYEIPENDLMRSGQNISNFDVKLTLDGMVSGKWQNFPK